MLTWDGLRIWRFQGHLARVSLSCFRNIRHPFEPTRHCLYFPTVCHPRRVLHEGVLTGK